MTTIASSSAQATQASTSIPAPAPTTAAIDTMTDNTIKEVPLPKLSQHEFNAYNKLAVMMEYYHNRFRQTWRTMYTACETNTRPKNMTINQFINIGIQFVHHLTGHHDIEEYHIFPVLGKKMSEFNHHAATTIKENGSTVVDSRAKLMVLQHKQIHAGLERLEAWLEEARSGKRDFRLQGEGGLKEVMDSFREVLWTHLDEEIRTLGAENMRKYWTLDEMKGFNW